MKAIRIQKRIESENLHLPEVKPFIGQTVEIIVMEQSCPSTRSAAVNRFLALAPEEGPFDPKEIEALRADPKYERFWPLLDVAGQEIIDADAIAELRAASML